MGKHCKEAKKLDINDFKPLYREDFGSVDPRLSATDVMASGQLVVRVPNWLGDSLIAMPALYQLRQALGEQARMTILCRSHLQPLWRMAYWVDSIIAFSGSRLKGEARRELQYLHADAALILPNSLGSVLDITGMNIPVRVGRAGRGRRIFLTHCLPAWRRHWRNSKWHQSNHYYDLVEAIGPVRRGCVQEPLLRVEDEVIQRVKDRFISTFVADRPLLVVAPGAAYGPAKRWPAEFFRQVVSDCCTKAGFSVAVAGTADDNSLGAEICRGTVHAVNLCGLTSLEELAALLVMAHMCLCNDSGTMHLAAALGTPGVAIFGSTCESATGPLGDNWLVLSGASDCRPCFRSDCRRRDAAEYECLRSVSPGSVFKAIVGTVKK